MKAEQVEKLRKILITEKDKIAEIDAQYSNDVSAPNSNFDAQEFQRRRKIWLELSMNMRLKKKS